ncbi:DUF4876 domain-containing protein [Fulvitalea axinellae]|uniref:DUF4876 domain-containing protein n=1 Tax=Fulvitalea axinellae TaxID=1182444 RepID=A0AAU9CJE2_9BACT|nr:DUF4876 domain-containing protein [Fulvitalea axinellae]
MKIQQFHKALIMAFLAIPFFACDSDDSDPVVPVDFSVTVKHSETFENQVVKNLEVIATNTANQTELKVTTDETGTAKFMGLTPGEYSFSAKLTMTPEQFLNFAAQKVEDDVVFNVNQGNVSVNVTSPTSLNLVLVTGKVGNLLIKQIYYTGSDIQEGALFRDQFIEIYNNSTEVIYADSLHIAQINGRTSSSVKDYTLPNGQFDWSKSLNMSPANDEANTEYVYAKALFRIPGTGKQYPIQPGESIILAQNGLNHKAPFTDKNGNQVTVKNPALTVDLSGADFEVFMNDDYVSDLDAPNVPNVDALLNPNRDLVLNPQGKEAYVIFKTSEKIEDSWKKYPDPSVKEVNERTKFNYQIPNNLVIDAVQLQFSPSKIYNARIHDHQDAGYSYAPKGAFSSQSIIRKTAKEFAGRKILQDTNNSSEDFTTLDIANPRGFAQ